MKIRCSQFFSSLFLKLKLCIATILGVCFSSNYEETIRDVKIKYVRGVYALKKRHTLLSLGFKDSQVSFLFKNFTVEYGYFGALLALAIRYPSFRSDYRIQGKTLNNLKFRWNMDRVLNFLGADFSNMLPITKARKIRTLVFGVGLQMCPPLRRWVNAETFVGRAFVMDKLYGALVALLKLPNSEFPAMPEGIDFIRGTEKDGVDASLLVGEDEVLTNDKTPSNPSVNFN